MTLSRRPQVLQAFSLLLLMTLLLFSIESFPAVAASIRPSPKLPRRLDAAAGGGPVVSNKPHTRVTEKETVSWIAGTLLALVASFFSAMAKTFLKVVHNIRQGGSVNSPSSRRDPNEGFARDPQETQAARPRTYRERLLADGAKWLFYLACILLALQPVLDLCALKMAPESMVAASSGTTSAWQLFFSVTFLREPWGVLDIIGNALVCLGCIGIGIIGAQEEKVEYGFGELLGRFTSPKFLGFSLLWAIWMCLMLSFIKLKTGVGRDGRGRPDPNTPEALSFRAQCKKFAWGSISGSIGGLFVFTKCALSFLDQGSEPWGHWECYVIILTAIGCALGGVVLLNEGLRRYDAVFITPVYQGLIIVVGSLSGAAFFDELRGFSTWGYVTFLGALAAIAVGLYVVLVAGIDPARKGLPPGVHENFGRKSSVQLETRALPVGRATDIVAEATEL
jgi:drug/metabolite transporter (DMT)-like permease